MNFVITRTAEHGDIKPCKEAFKSKIKYWHTRTCNEKEFNDKFSDREGLWKSKGKNHKVTKDGYITRQEEDRETWMVEINSLEELLKFQKKYGELVLSHSYLDDKTNSIEIYNDYRE